MSVEDIISPVYLVGGSVRDTLLGKEPKDYDYCTPVLPDDIERLVKESGHRAFVTGKRFGTIGFNLEGKFIEITTFRSETYGETRKPDVEFVSSIQQDLSRRDFTINAIAKRGKRYIDPFGGRIDLEKRIIRAVGNPTQRFKEDPLRMLRAVRFVAQLGFEIDPDTFKSIQKNAHSILSVSKERWIQEIDRLLMSEYVYDGLGILFESGLMKFVLPELQIQYMYDQNSDYHALTLAEHTMKTVEQSPKELNTRWAALLHDVGKPFVRTDNRRGSSNYIFHDTVGAELVYGIGKRLKWSNERLKEVQDLVKNHLSDESPIREADNFSKQGDPLQSK